MRISPDGSESGAIPSLAQRLETSPEDLARALDEIPWRDLRTAEFLGIQKATNHDTQMEVVKLRMRALRFIRWYTEKSGVAH